MFRSVAVTPAAARLHNMHTTEKLTAALAGRYLLERQIGEGGMATVYLARDLRHNRRVAIKVLRPELQAVIGAERFLAEIETTANMRHPNLLPLFDSGEANGVLYYVMPFIEGESLRARIDRERQLAVEEAIRITVGAARALDYAHRRGVIHRDLKPENVLLEEGQPLIADFGIALALSRAGGERVTQTGISLGTPQYMSPEQATGDRDLDGRSDIYSLAAVLYEMLTGTPPHTGPTVQAIIASIVTRDARPVSDLRKTVPVHVQAVIERALAKVPADRFASAGEFATALENPAAVTIPLPQRQAAPARPNRRLLAAAGIAAVAIGAAGWSIGRATVPDTLRSPTRSITLGDAAPLALTTDIPTIGYNSTVLALSPSGRLLAFVASTPSGRQLHLRDLQTNETRPLAGTEGAVHAFFSPDGQELGFVTPDRVKKLSLRGGSVTTLAEASIPTRGWWPRPDVIYFGEDEAATLARVPASGGPVERNVTDGVRARFYFDVLPDGRAIASGEGGANSDAQELMVVDPGARTSTSLNLSGSGARYAAPGFLLLVRGGQLLAVRFDLATLTVKGEPVSIASGVTTETLFAITHVAVSATGAIAYVPGGNLSLGKLAWVDRRGNVTDIPAPEQVYGAVDLSPDDNRIAVHVADVKDYVMVWDAARREPRRVSSDVHEGYPRWDRRGATLITHSSDSSSGFFRVRPMIAGAPQDMGDVTRSASFGDASPDGSLLALRRAGALRFFDTRSRQLTGVELRDAWFPAFSPDGRWIAHASNRDGKVNIFIASVSDGRAAGQVSLSGGIEPVWLPSGDLFYRDGNRWYVTRVTTTPEPQWAPPTRAFETEFTDTPGWSYDVSSDGQRLLVVKRAHAVDRQRVTIITNWLQALDESR